MPIYAFFVDAFFPRYKALIFVGLYLLGIVLAILMALVFKKTLFRGKAVPFVMELPNYRLPGLKNVGRLLWEKAKDFLHRAFTVIFIATIIIWLLQSFDLHFNLVSDQKDSILAAVAGLLVPLMRPVGLGDWRICTSPPGADPFISRKDVMIDKEKGLSDNLIVKESQSAKEA